MNSRPLAANRALWIAIRPSTNSRLRCRTPAMSRDHGSTRNPNVAAWRTSSTTLALWIVFLLGRQGALLLLMAVHYDLSVIAIVGIILFIGIVKKNGIMLVDFAQHVEHEQGVTAEESIFQHCIMRFRPILMTTMAALLGGVPMMLGSGVGSELRQPLGYAIVGGLALSQVLTLYTTPVVYIYLDRLKTWLFGAKKPAPSGHAAPAPAE